MAATPHHEKPKSVTGEKDFEEVRKAERAYIRRRRHEKGKEPPGDAAVDDSLVGLAFSGGGIRSATTNLGIVQALSRMGILRHVDYLSTVSGGGYIGGCLSAMLSVNKDHETKAGTESQFEINSRDDLKFDTQWKRFPFNPRRAPSATGPLARRADLTEGTNIVAHLRTHGDFLVARRSIVKRETLRAVGTLIGGLLYTVLLTVLTLSLASLILLGAAHAISGDLKRWKTPDDPANPDKYTVAATLADSQLRYTRTPDGATVQEATDPQLWTHLKHRLGLIWDDMTSDITTLEIGAAFGAGAGLTLIVLVFFIVAARVWKGPDIWAAGESREDAFEVRLLWLAAALLMLGMIIVPIVDAQAANSRERAAWLLQPFFVATGAYVAAFVAYGVVFALLGMHLKLWTRGCRSLWGSYLAISLYGLAVALAFAVFPAASYAAHAVGIGGVLAPVGSLLVGRLLMTRAVTGAAERFELSKKALHILLGAVVAGLVFFTMIEVGALGIDYGFIDPIVDPKEPPRSTIYGLNARFVLALVITGSVLLLLSFLVNLNRIGLHYFYRDRILETYLRSEVAKDGDGGRMRTFVDTMEMKLQDLHGRQANNAQAGNRAPYLLVSAALNLAGSRDLTRKDRKSGYFLFSKYFCGSKQTGYLETDRYAGGHTQLARALTVSGAAAGTGMGYQTFFAQSFLTALFNIRLGQWVPNPRRNSGQTFVFWPRYIVREVLGLTNEWTKLVNVSDGGHTGDNVGIYPLLERRCQVIIACDAEADAAITFGSFTEAMRHAYVDLGIDIDIDLSMITPDPTTGLSQSHCAIGRIRYPECPYRPSWLIYMKNSMTGNEPAPILNYKKTSPLFPHESTADQFFDDAQFESYRALGDHIAEETFARWILDQEVRHALNDKEPEPKAKCGHVLKGWHKKPKLVWDGLRILHSPFKAADNTKFRELTQQLGELEQLFFESPELRWYYDDCMQLPAPTARPAGSVVPVNVIATQIQLMEDTYFAVRLDLYANARDNRGWMNLFRRWGNSKTFNETFGQLQSNYSNDFVAFYCNYVQNWGEIDYLPIPHAWDVGPNLDKNHEYTHPSAVICSERDAPGLFQDNGRQEARAPEPGEPVEQLVIHPGPGEHGGSGAVDESRSPTPPSPPPESGKE